MIKTLFSIQLLVYVFCGWNFVKFSSLHLICFRSFLMMYHVPNSSGEGTLALVDDWDLDAALQQFRHSMKITIQTSDGITNSGRLFLP